MKIDFETLRRAGLTVKLLYPHPEPRPGGLHVPSGHVPFENSNPTGVEVHVQDDGKARKRLRKAVKEAFPVAPATFVDDAVDDLCDELVAHSIARVCLDAERREAEGVEDHGGAGDKDDLPI